MNTTPQPLGYRRRPPVLPEYADRPAPVDPDLALAALDRKVEKLSAEIGSVNVQIRQFLKTYMRAVDGRITFAAETATARARLGQRLRQMEDKRDALMREHTLALTERTALRSRRPR